ncbi:protein of unknown function [Cupriavidus taiwanensis]|uniref:Uncharacterized protein n=1 Tax=Cupriavidus taiwanensis TaxID=164546 RepID=A0A7Z7J9W1_9BURK|nr:protein of unknown function [Cupriavidus taiwanensis]SOZ03277.1 hypothetical protein CBM2597_A120007 [Cupriavidus taiwanensis]SOZ06557.1 hypothetical protein CBM2595_A81242 [Cupriavidus taiwanensis]SPC20075.1 hypothetical protein CBM2594_A90008 [Cupriavidus taiwanensis]SPD41673.1 protein of unknown function [Cupriavidus taiwanensis]
MSVPCHLANSLQSGGLSDLRSDKKILQKMCACARLAPIPCRSAVPGNVAPPHTCRRVWQLRLSRLVFRIRFTILGPVSRIDHYI